MSKRQTTALPLIRATDNKLILTWPKCVTIVVESAGVATYRDGQWRAASADVDQDAQAVAKEIKAALKQQMPADQTTEDGQFPHRACLTPDQCRRGQICLDGWNCSAAAKDEAKTTFTVDLEREELSELLDYLQTEARRHARLADMLDNPYKADEKRQHLELEQHYRKRHWLLSRAHLHDR